MKPPSETLSFRLPTEFLEELDQRIAEHKDRFNREYSRGDFARKIVIEYLTDAERQETRKHIKATQADLHKLREDIATAITAVLVNIAKADPVQVDRWVKGALFPDSEG